MTVEVRGFSYGDGSVSAHVHLAGSQCTNYGFHTYEHPALQSALDEVERCIAGAVIQTAQQVAATSVPENVEIEVGHCKICGAAVATSDPGMRQNGPFLYCPSHA